MESIVVALIGGIVTLAGVLIANSRTQAAIEAKLNELTKRVDKHNQLMLFRTNVGICAMKDLIASYNDRQHQRRGWEVAHEHRRRNRAG